MSHRPGRVVATLSVVMVSCSVAPGRGPEQAAVDDPLLARPIWVIGEVVRPGALDHRAGLTLADALAASGGPGSAAWRERIVVRSGGANAPGAAVDPDHVLRPGDVVEVPARIF
jgi:hypothetical protein